MKALVIGATGATGKDLVNILLNSPAYTAVVIFVRRSTGIVHPKLEEVLTDFDKLEAIANHITGDVLFSLLGTTLKIAGSKEAQQHIDYEIPLKFAEIAKSNGVKATVLLSAYGATPSSRIFYSRLKGNLEKEIGKLAFDQFIIFRPGLLLRQNTDRRGERISASLLKALNSVGIIKRFRPMPTHTLAEKMAKALNHFTGGTHAIELNKIFEL
ncbi:MAG: NAD(P)H-binding protein [Chitinophagaceae bacterium]